jgi:ABC-type multidrug transport system ATPase subunit
MTTTPREKSTSPPSSKNRLSNHRYSRVTAPSSSPVPICTCTFCKVIFLLFGMTYLASKIISKQTELNFHALNIRFADEDGDGLLDTNVTGLDQLASIDDKGIPITIEWKDLMVQRVIHEGTPAQKLITTVRKNSGSMTPGELTAIMGGSGSGKSTLVRALMGRQDTAEHVTGTIKVNGKKVLQNSSNFFATLVGFVPQEDVMHDDLSIEENLQFSAEWRLNENDFPLDQRRGVVEDVMARLAISKWRHDRVGRGSDTEKSHISGGQKKRVNIGIELVADPGVLFLDEPTSGLDSATTMKIISELKATAINASLPIAAVVHQPSDKVFHLFTSLLLMARGGNVIYQGPTNNAVAYFSSIGFQKYVKDYSNPADFLMDIVEGIIDPDCNSISSSSIASDDECQKYDYLDTPYQWWLKYRKANPLTPTTSKEVHGSVRDTPKKTSFGQQLNLLFYRSVYLLQKSSGIYDIILISFVATMCAVSSAKLNSKFGTNLVASAFANQAIALGASMVSVVQAIPEFDAERLTFERERNVGLNVYSFTLAKFGSSLFVITTMPFIFVVVYTFVLHLATRWIKKPLTSSNSSSSSRAIPRSVGSFGGVIQFYWMLVINSFTAASYSQLLSLLLPADKAMLAGVLMLIFMNLASNISEKLGELSFMNSFNLWCLALDAMPLKDVEQWTNKKRINIALSEAKSAKYNNDTIASGATSSGGGRVIGFNELLEKLIPKMKNDNDVLKANNIDRGIGTHAELSLLLSGLFMRSISICILSHQMNAARSLFMVYISLWIIGAFKVARISPPVATKEEKESLDKAVLILTALDKKTETELDAMQNQLLGMQRPHF